MVFDSEWNPAPLLAQLKFNAGLDLTGRGS